MICRWLSALFILLALSGGARAACTASADNATLNAGSTSCLTDANGIGWALPYNKGPVSVQSTIIPTTSNAVQLGYANGAMWYKDTSNNWRKLTYSSTTGVSVGAPTVTSPLIGPVPYPLTGTVTTGSYRLGLHFPFVGKKADGTALNSPSGLNYLQYHILEPYGYDRTKYTWPLFFVGHGLGQGGLPYPRESGSFIGGLESDGFKFNTTAFRTAHPAITVAIQCDQDSDSGGATYNCGGYGSAINWNAQAINALMAAFVNGTITDASGNPYSITPGQHIGYGLSLSAIGFLDQMINNNSVQPIGSGLWDVGVGLSTQHTISGVSNSSLYNRMITVPYFEVCKQGDNACNWGPGLWNVIAGNSTYNTRPDGTKITANSFPSKANYDSGGVNATRAGNTQFHYIDDTYSGTAYNNFGCMNADGCDGTALLAWVFSIVGNSSGGPGTPTPPPPTTCTTESPDQSVITTVGPSITDSNCDVWTISSNAKMAKNGVIDNSTANVIEIAYANKVVWQLNTSQDWYSVSPSGGPTKTCPLLSCGGIETLTVDPIATVAPNTAFTVTGNISNVTATPALQYSDNGSATWTDFPTDATVTTAFYSFSHAGMSANTAATVSVRDKNATAIFATSASFTVGTAPVATGNFSVSGGYIIDPTGAKFIPVGTNIYERSISAVVQDSTGFPANKLFPGINYIRVMVCSSGSCTGNGIGGGGTNNPTSISYLAITRYKQLADWCQASKIVCNFEDHTSNGGYWQFTNSYNVYHSVEPTGTLLTSMTNFWASMAKQFIGNPYAWIGSQNEPNFAAEGPYHTALYNAIRAANDGKGNKNNNIVQLCGGLGCGVDSWLGPAALYSGTSPYTNMTNVIFFLHNYDSSSSPGAHLAGSATAGTGGKGGPGCYGYKCLQQITTKDGNVPVVIDEWGGTSGNTQDSSNSGMASAMTNAFSDKVGGAAFVWSNCGGTAPTGGGCFDQVINGNSTGLTVGSGSNQYHLTPWGNQVAAWIKANPFPGNNGPGVPTVETLTVDAHNPVPQNTAFTVTGTIKNVTAAPTLQYQNNNSGWNVFPTGAVVNTTTFSFTDPGMASNPAATVSVRDANNTAISATGPPFVVTGQASPNCTIITPGSGVFTDGSNVYSITSGLLAQQNGNNIAGGNNTGQGEWYNGLVYFQDNTSKQWYTWNGSTFSTATAPGSCAAVESLSINNIPNQVANISFNVSGAIVGLTAAPTLQYQINSGAWTDFPTGSSVTNLTFSFTSPGIAVGANNVINVRDKANTNATAASNAFAVNAGAESANKTVITTTTQNLTDAAGKIWTFNSSGQVLINGAADTTTSGVTQMAYVNHTVWYLNGSGKWFYNPTGVAGNWQPPGGTTSSPLNINESPDRTIVTTVGPAVTDQYGITFALTAGNKVSIAGAAPTLTNIVEIAYVNHTVWVENSDLAWSSYSNGVWSALTSISPLLTEIIIVDTISDQASGVTFPVTGTAANVSATPTLNYQVNSGPWNAFPTGSTVTLNGPGTPTFADYFTSLSDVSDTGGPATGPVVSITPTPSGQSFLDTSGNTWTISGSQVFKNGSAAGTSSGVAQLLLVKGAVWYINTGGNWFNWNGTAWVPGMNPLLGGATGAWRNSYSFGGSEYTLSYNNELEYYSSGTRAPNWSPFSLQNGGAGPGLIITVDTTSHASFRAGHTPDNPLNLAYNSGLINSAVQIPPPLLNNSTPAPGILTYQYGYLEVQALLPGGPGEWVSWSLYPLAGSGEIDLVETGGDDLLHVHNTVHSSTTNVTQPVAVTDYTQNRHVYGVDWQADHITWYVDHVQSMQIVTPTDMIGKPYYVTLGLAIQGSPTQGFDGIPTAASVFPAQMYIDWVKKWPNFAASQNKIAGTTAYWNFNAPAMTVNPTNTISVRDANNTTVVGFSNGFAIINKEALSISPIVQQTAGVSFKVSGTIVNTTTTPTLQYQNDNGPWQALPAGFSVTSTAFNFTNPGLAQGAHTVSVRDANTITIAATASVTVNAAPVNQGWNPSDTSTTITLSNTNQTATSTAAQQGGSRGIVSRTTGKYCFDETLNTVTPGMSVGISNSNFVLAGSSTVTSITATPSGQVLTDVTGHNWTIVNGVALRDGTAPSFSSNVVQISLVNGVVYSKNSSNQWYQFSGTAWVGYPSDPTVGTPTTGAALGQTANGIGFLPGSATAPQSINYNGVQVLASPSGTSNSITPTSGGTLTDTAGNKWTMSGTGINAVVLMNGVQVPDSRGTKTFTIVNGNTYYGQDFTTGSWYTYSLTTQKWTPASAPPLTTTSQPDVAGDPVTICVDLDAHTEWVSTPVMRQTLNQTWNSALLTVVDPSKGTGGVSFNGLLCPCYPTMTTPDNGTKVTLNTAGPLTITLPSGFTVWQPQAAIIHHPFIINLGMLEPANDNDDLLGLRKAV